MNETCYADADQRNSFTTVSGRRFSFANPTPDMVDLGDIAHALSLTARYGGHTPDFYSVAQHSVHVAAHLGKSADAAAQFSGVSGDWQTLMLLALLHDAAEAYTGDVISPLKNLLPDFQVIEARVEAAICEHFRLPTPQQWPDAYRLVKRADQETFAGEDWTLRGNTEEGFKTLGDPGLWARRSWEIGACWSPKQARHEFLFAAKRLGLR